MADLNRFRNIETDFRKFRFFAVLCIGVSLVIVALVSYSSIRMVSDATNKVYILDNGKTLLAAFKTNADENRPAEAKSHAKRLLNLIFSMSPDKALIDENIAQAVYLGDTSVYATIANLKESKFYDRMIAATASSKLVFDSTSFNIDVSKYPYKIDVNCTNYITRSSVIEERKLYCSMDMRVVERSDNNPHGLIVEKFSPKSEIIKTYNRN